MIYAKLHEKERRIGPEKEQALNQILNLNIDTLTSHQLDSRAKQKPPYLVFNKGNYVIFD